MTEAKDINLLEKEPLEKKSPKKKFLGWLFTSGKAIIILTNVVTIGAFVLRVKLDQEKLDLKERAATQERVVKADGAFEKEFRAFQSKVDFLKELSQKKPLTPALSFLEDNIPKEIVVEKATVNEATLELLLNAQSSRSLSVMAIKMLQNGAGEIVLSEAHLDRESGTYRFGIIVSLLGGV